MKKLIVLVAVLIAGCATQPDKITNSYVSPLLYKEYTCDQIATETGNVERRASDLHTMLKKSADDDAGQMAVGMVIFWPALFFLEGGDGPEATEYARLKGEKVALETVAVEKECFSKMASVAAANPQLTSFPSENGNATREAALESAIANVGDKWKYRLLDGTRAIGMVSVEIVESNGNRVRERITREGYNFRIDRDVETAFDPTRFLPQVALSGGYQLSELSPYFPDGTALKSGTVWNNVPGEFLFFYIGKQQLLAKVTVVSQETVNVPAGTFRAWKVDADVSEARGSAYSAKLHCTFWYAPESRRAVKMRYATTASKPVDSRVETYELVAIEPRR